MKELVVVTGKKRSGKDTFGNYLVNCYDYKKAQPFACFKTAIKNWFGFTEEQMNGSLKEVIDERWGVSPRALMQIFGTDLMRGDLNFYFPELEKKVGKGLWAKVFKTWYLRQPDGKYVVCDWRFPEERAELLDLPNVTFVKIVNPRIKSIDEHVSETSIDTLTYDYQVLNDGTLDQFYLRIEYLWLKIYNKHLVSH